MITLLLVLATGVSAYSAEQKFCDLDVSAQTKKIYKQFSGHSFGSYYQALGKATTKCAAEGYTKCYPISSESWDPIWSVFVQVRGEKEAPDQAETQRLNKCNKIDSCYEKMILTQTNDPQLKSGLEELSDRYNCHTETSTSTTGQVSDSQQ